MLPHGLLRPFPMGPAPALGFPRMSFMLDSLRIHIHQTFITLAIWRR